MQQKKRKRKIATMAQDRDFKKLLPFLIFFGFALKYCEGWRLSEGHDLATKIMNFSEGVSIAFGRIYPSFVIADYYYSAIATLIFSGFVYLKSQNRKKYRKGVEYGSARWGGAQDIAPLINPIFQQNIILSATERMSVGRIEDKRYSNINRNILCIGGSGSGKTRYFITPALMNMNASYVVSDPKGTLVSNVGHLLRTHRYKIKILNTINFSEGMHYNPLAYVKNELDIMKLITVLMENTQGEETKKGEDFWEKAEALFYQALIAYILSEAPEEEQNLSTLLAMINACECREDDEDFKNAVDLLFEQLEEREPDHFAVKQYKKFKLAAGKTMKSILITAASRLGCFEIGTIKEMMAYDDLELDKIGDRKTALFVITSDTDKTFNFIGAMMYSQMFNILCDKALNDYGGSLPVHVTCLLDEFANQKIPSWEHLISVIRSRNISAAMCLQAKSQLKGPYKDNAETIEGCCSTLLFLGGKERTSLKEISELLGKETIDSYNESDTRGSQRSSGINYQKLGKELMTPDELAVMPSDECILQIQGLRPFRSKKYDITTHPMYKYLGEVDSKNKFNVKKYIEKQGGVKISDKDTYDIFEIINADLSEEESDFFYEFEENENGGIE